MIAIKYGTDFLLRQPETRKGEKLPPAVFSIKVSLEGIVLKFDRDRFTMPETIYGDQKEKVARIIANYKRGKYNSNCILYGNPGTGKSLLAADLCNQMIAMGHPVIKVEGDYTAETLKAVLEVAPECVLYFEEFGKHYNDEDARARLTDFFSDPQYINSIFLVTGNSEEELPVYSTSRPGRFRFKFCYHVTGQSVLEDIAKLEGLTGWRGAMWWYYTSPSFNMDSLLVIADVIKHAENELMAYKELMALNVGLENKDAVWDVSKMSVKGAFLYNSDNRYAAEITLSDDYTVTTTFTDQNGVIVGEAINDFTRSCPIFILGPDNLEVRLDLTFRRENAGKTTRITSTTTAEAEEMAEKRRIEMAERYGQAGQGSPYSQPVLQRSTMPRASMSVNGYQTTRGGNSY